MSGALIYTIAISVAAAISAFVAVVACFADEFALIELREQDPPRSTRPPKETSQ